MDFQKDIIPVRLVRDANNTLVSVGSVKFFDYIFDKIQPESANQIRQLPSQQQPIAGLLALCLCQNTDEILRAFNQLREKKRELQPSSIREIAECVGAAYDMTADAFLSAPPNEFSRKYAWASFCHILFFEFHQTYPQIGRITGKSDKTIWTYINRIRVLSNKMDADQKAIELNAKAKESVRKLKIDYVNN